MNYYLIDYENISDTAGLYGAEYLGSDDCLEFFYSQSCDVIRNDIWNIILQSGCQVKMYKLQTQRENALDFYIAAEASALCERGVRQVAIISKDKDLNSVSEFLKMKTNSSDFHISRVPSLEHAISVMNDPSGKDRRNKIIAARTQKTMENAYKEYIQEENLREKEKRSQSNAITIRSVFEDKGIENCEKIITIWEEITSYNEMYKRCRKEFGSREGTGIYKVLKELYENGQL